MTTKLAITGFGRIGRCVLRAYFEETELWPDVEIVAVNAPGDIMTHAHLFQFDSVHGIFDGDLEVDTDARTMIIDGHTIQILDERDPAKLGWAALGVDIVLECTGRFNGTDLAMPHISEGGAKKVLLSAPGKPADLTVVYGVNHEDLTAEHNVVSNASCTTNCLAPVAKVLDEKFGVEHGLITTIHAYTSDQMLLDGKHKDLRRARAAAMSMVPTSTGAAKAVGLVLPELDGKLDGLAIRVPTPNVSLVDLVFRPKTPVSIEEVNEALIEASENELEGVLAVCGAPLVSTDFNHTSVSSIVDLLETKTIDGGQMIKVLSWYDNEFGFSCRMLDVAQYWGQKL